MMSEDLKKEVAKFAVGVAMLGIIAEVVIAVIFYTHNDFWKFVLSTAVGCAYVIFNFAFTAVSLHKATSKGDKAKMHMQISYYLRMLILVGVVLAAIYIPILNVYCVVIPLLFTRIVIIAEAFLFKNKDGKKDEC